MSNSPVEEVSPIHGTSTSVSSLQGIVTAADRSSRPLAADAGSGRGTESQHPYEASDAVADGSPRGAQPDPHSLDEKDERRDRSRDGEEGARDEEDEDEDDEDEDEDDEDEDEEEPSLKYSRIKGNISEMLARDSASAVAITAQVIAIGTHNGMVHLLTYEGTRINSFRLHSASITCLRLDDDNDFVATASVEGRVVIHSLTSSESYAFDYKRPMRTIALEPGFAKKASRSFVCGGMAGNLVFQEKGWLGYKEQILHSGEGPIWASEWRGSLIAWANDKKGVKVHDTTSGLRIGYIDRGTDAPRPELFKCSLLWTDDQTLVIGWAEHIKVVRVRDRSRAQHSGPQLALELTAIYQVDCMISGLVPHRSSYIVLAYIPPDSFDNEATEDREEQRRKAANPPELRIISKGEEISADALSLANFHRYGCNDYLIVSSARPQEELHFVISPSDIIAVRPRDEADHIDWLVDHGQFAEALDTAERLRSRHGSVFDVKSIGLRYMRHLMAESEYAQAASLAPRVLNQDRDAWEKWVDEFAQCQQLATIAPLVPVRQPRLPRSIYETILGDLLLHDRSAFLSRIKQWPADIYDMDTVIRAIRSEQTTGPADDLLLEALAEVYLANRQPAQALPYLLRIRRPDVFDLVRENNLFSAIQNDVLSLVDYDRSMEHTDGTKIESETHGPAIKLLVDHLHSISMDKVIRQLDGCPEYLYAYLDAIFRKDPQLCMPYSNRMVELYASFGTARLMTFLRASNFYDLEKAYSICKDHDLVEEMVFLLGRMGNNKQALMLIIERLKDVQKAIDFAKEQGDDDLWEDLLSYSEDRPAFIRALLEHVSAEINPIRLIQRIRNGLEIPGLRPAVIKVLQASNLQVSLLDGCQHILDSDCNAFAARLQKAQTGSMQDAPDGVCEICELPLYTSINGEPPLALLYLCRHTVHARCAIRTQDSEFPSRSDDASVIDLLSTDATRGKLTMQRQLGARLSFAASVRVRVGSCPVCAHSRGDTAPAFLASRRVPAIA